MNGGAYVAIAASARARLMQQVVDAYRLADATSLDRARALEDVGVVPRRSEVEDLVQHSVLVPGRRDGTYYVDERGYIAHRESRRKRARIAVLVAILCVAAIIGAGMIGVLRGG